MEEWWLIALVDQSSPFLCETVCFDGNTTMAIDYFKGQFYFRIVIMKGIRTLTKESDSVSKDMEPHHNPEFCVRCYVSDLIGVGLNMMKISTVWPSPLHIVESLDWLSSLEKELGRWFMPKQVRFDGSMAKIRNAHIIWWGRPRGSACPR